MKNFLLGVCFFVFVGVTVNIALAETSSEQKAKQIGLNQASPNQMLTQKLGTEVMVNSQKVVVVSKKFSSLTPTTSGTYTVGYIPKCNIMTTGAYLSVPQTLVQGVASTSLSFAVSGVTLLPTTQVSSAPTQNAPASATATLAALSGCDRDIPVTMTVSGTIQSGKIDFVIPYIPYNQTQ